MKRFFTSLKSVVCVALVACMMGTSVVSCSYDDTDIKNQISEINKELAALKDRVADLETRLQSEVDALTALINGKVVVTSVEKQGDNTVVTLSNDTSFIVYGECDVTGDGNTTLAPAKDNDGVYYWAVYNYGEFSKFLEVEGEKVPVFCEEDGDSCTCEPADLKFMVDETSGNLLVSIDGGKTWVDSGVSAQGATAGSCVFTDVVVNEDGTVTFVLADGSEVVVSQAELIEFNVRGSLYVKAGETKDVTFEAGETVSDVEVMNQPMGWKAVVAENVLSVTAPKAELVNMGVAEKSGTIALHITTASGACKVAKLQVNFAELSLEVTKEGNITVKNSLVDTFQAYDYETWEYVQKTDFVTYSLGAMYLDDFSGDIVADLNNWDITTWSCNDENVGYYLTDYVYDRQPYVEGVFEERVLTTTVKSLVEDLSYGSATYDGNSFIVYVVPMNMSTWSLEADKAVYTEFTQLSVKGEAVSTTFCDAVLNVTMRGGVEYHLMYVEARYIDQMVDYGYSASEYYQTNFYNWINYGMDWGQHVIREDISGEFTLYDIMNYNSPWAMNTTLTPATEYEFAILPVEEGREKESYGYDDLCIFRFTTASLVEAETPADITVEFVADYSSITATVTVPETIVGVYSAWYDNEFDGSTEEYINNHVASAWYKSDFTEGYTYKLDVGYLNTNQTKHLVLLAVDAAGNYTLVQNSATTLTPEVNTQYTLGIEEYSFANDIFTVKLSGIDGAEVVKYRYYMVNVDYYNQKSNETIEGEMAISTNWMYQTIEGEKVTNPVEIILGLKSYNYDYLVAGTTYKFAILAVFADGTFSNVAFVDEAEYALNVVGESDEKWAATKPELIDLNCVYSSYGYWEVSYNFTTADGVTVYTRMTDPETIASYPFDKQKVAYLVDNTISYWDGCYSGYANTLQYDLWYCWSDAEGNYYAPVCYDLEADLAAAQQ